MLPLAEVAIESQTLGDLKVEMTQGSICLPDLPAILQSRKRAGILCETGIGEPRIYRPGWIRAGQQPIERLPRLLQLLDECRTVHVSCNLTMIF